MSRSIFKLAVARGGDEGMRGMKAMGAEGAEMALRMNALFYFDCLGHQELKHITLLALGALCCNLDGLFR